MQWVFRWEKLSAAPAKEFKPSGGAEEAKQQPTCALLSGGVDDRGDFEEDAFALLRAGVSEGVLRSSASALGARSPPPAPESGVASAR